MSDSSVVDAVEGVEVPEARDPIWETTIAWSWYERLRPNCHAPTPTAGKAIAKQVIATLHTCLIPEVARFGRALRAWRVQILACYATDGVSHGGTKATNLIIDKTRRLPDGVRALTADRLRILLAASGDRAWRVNHAWIRRGPQGRPRDPWTSIGPPGADPASPSWVQGPLPIPD